ncbi:DUF3307 domain-containing protein [uncultured Bacteroides sp.]|uniref:DUF3307 domain-containing protein n=1 Tax=uncultured Bacteroides sp. TaxID=162156 RepID=UPI002AABCD26|nr:DUF3307 domain-containing protein [uncultured Bacteroides sp.]
MGITILFKLLFVHILSDFVLQTDSICKGKKKEGAAKVGFQILHSLIHAVLAYLFVAQWDNWIIPVVIFVTHLMMDFIKSDYLKENMTTFIIDQAVHIAVIFLLWFSLYGYAEHWFEWFSYYLSNPRLWALITAYLLILKPTSIFLSLFIKRWTPEESASQSLPNAGKWIGYLERILILTFILAGKIEGVGFLLAAKSIFRFGELNKAKEIKITEYVLIGTFASFTIAILIGFITSQLL